MTNRETMHESSHRFGGRWTTEKLDVLAGYLKAYTTALKRRQFTTGYIDAFAGSGYREPKKDTSGDHLIAPWLEAADQEPQKYLAGSALNALQIEPRFDKYIFIEKNAGRVQSLEKLRDRFPDLHEDIRIEQGDANIKIQELRDKDWSQHRAVLFLDPYGLQVEWKTLEAVAKTKAIDLWVLFPLSGVNRMLTKDGNIPESWVATLNRLFGTEDWYDEFYRPDPERTLSLFDDEQERVVKVRMDTIARYFNERLKTIFSGVADKPGVLRNSRGSPLYLFCFAVANESERAKNIALGIAEHLLRDMR